METLIKNIKTMFALVLIEKKVVIRLVSYYFSNICMYFWHTEQ